MVGIAQMQLDCLEGPGLYRRGGEETTLCCDLLVGDFDSSENKKVLTSTKLFSLTGCACDMYACCAI